MTDPLRIGLLGVGLVGSAVARVAAARAQTIERPIHVTAGLVRNLRAPGRPDTVTLTANGFAVLDTQPEVVVEVLGGLEPARTLILEALTRGIPVVTANKSLLAHHGEEILDAAAATGVPIRYEAAVIAGVPFLGTFARRPFASVFTTLTGIVNGTTNYILSAMADEGLELEVALAEAQRQGFAEPDPSKDIDGVDAAEKLVILIRQFFGVRVTLADIETIGIRNVTTADLERAHERGGTLKSLAFAQWRHGKLTAWVKPTFVPATHPLAGLRGALNGILLQDADGRELTFTGPGAGPEVTAVTILDDVIELVTDVRAKTETAAVLST
jgi:homoserine dehydrogenase